MAHDETLAARVRNLARDLTGDKPGVAEKKMFGGICLLVRGNMACGILKGDLIVRVGPEAYAACLDMDHARVFDLTGRIMKGWVMVSPPGLETDEDLAAWVARGLAFALTLPGKDKD